MNAAAAPTVVASALLAALFLQLLVPRLAPTRDVAFARARWFRWVPVVVAAVAAYPTLSLPCLADDWELSAVIGARSAPWEAFAPLRGAPWYRPMGWLVWWGLAKAAPGSGAAAHAVTSLLFLVCVALAPRALRRLRVPLGASRLAALLFAASPIALETVAWASNIYSFLGLAFALLAIVGIPRRASVLAWIPTLAFTLAACLSKEEFLTLPLWAAAVAMSRRAGGGGVGTRSAAIVGIRAAAIVGIPVALAIGARFVALGGWGGYTDAPGGFPVHLRPSFEQLSLAVPAALPGAILLPARRPLAWPGLETAGILALSAVVILAAASIPRGRAPRAPAALGFVSWLPVVGLVIDDPELGGARLLFVPAFFGWAVVAVWIAALPGAPAAKGIATFLLAALALATGRSNLRAWEESSRLLESTQRSCGAAVRDAPANAKILVEGLPASVRGAICFGAGEPIALAGVGGRTDVQWVGSILGFGSLAKLLEVDAKTGEVREPFRRPAAVVLAAGETWSFDPSRPGAHEEITPSCVSIEPLGGGRPLHVVGTGQSASVGFPTIALPENAEVEVICDASASSRDGTPHAVPLVVTIPEGDGLRRTVIAPGTYRLPAKVTRARLELNPVPPIAVELRALALRVKR